MKNLIICLLFAVSFTACNTSKKVTSSTSDTQGTSIATAIFVPEKTETKGVDWEYKWLAKNYKGYSLIQQSLIFDNSKPYDKMDIRIADGSKKTIYFDISGFFGKM